MARPPGVTTWVLVAALAVSAPAGAWLRADRPRPWAFPRDLGAHPGFRTEWWYFTGNLEDPRGGRYGYQLTFFRVGLRQAPLFPGNPWSVRDVFMAHLAVTDGPGRSFRYAEHAARPGPGLAGAAQDDLAVWVLSWQARRTPGGAIRLRGFARDFGVELVLEPTKPVVLHGAGGLSRKGPRPGQATYYASIPRLATRGTLTLGGRPVTVRGTSWFDHEFGSHPLGAEQAGWDWAGLHLSDGRDLMLYVIRRADGTREPASSGTLVEPGGRAVHLPGGTFSFEALGTWTSPRSGARYPAGWRIRVPWAGIDLVANPLLPDQELATPESTGITYWEGAVSGRGTSAGRPVTCRGYVELTGYAGSLGGGF